MDRRCRGLRGRHALESNATSPGDPLNHPRRSSEQPGAVLTVAEGRQHRLPDRVAGKAVRDELLEPVADLNPDAALPHGEDDKDAVVLLARPEAGVFEKFD